jgi:GNAT superfamily N-acetyltransferase
MMTYCASQILKHGPASLTTYALAVKRCSSFFPTLWGVMTEPGDRPYFLLKEIPNNRLNAGAARKQPPVHVRILADEHTKLPAMRSGLESIDRVTWSDRLFQMRTSLGTSTYVLEHGSTVVGFLTVHTDADRLTIAEVVVDQSHQSNGYGGILLRFAETLARQGDCRVIQLNAISDKVPVYQGFGFAQQPVAPIALDDETYHPMERLVLYHQGHQHIDGSAALPTDSAIRNTMG